MGSVGWIIFTAGIENRGPKFCSEFHNNFMVVVLLCVKIQQNVRQLMSTWRRHASLGLGVLLLLSESIMLAWSCGLLQINSCWSVSFHAVSMTSVHGESPFYSLNQLRGRLTVDDAPRVDAS
jgi:Na+/glutamate symporter